MLSDFLHILEGFLGIVAVLFLAYYLTRFYAKKFGATLGNSRNIKVIDRIPVGKGSSIAIIELQEKQYMVGITEHSINLLTELECNLPVAVDEQMPNIAEAPFFKTLKSVLTKESEDRHDNNK